jgi:hypothetical protein
MGDSDSSSAAAAAAAAVEQQQATNAWLGLISNLVTLEICGAIYDRQ